MGEPEKPKGKEIQKSPSADVIAEQLRLRQFSATFANRRRQLLMSIEPKAQKAKAEDDKRAEKDLQLGLAFTDPLEAGLARENVRNRAEQKAYFLMVGEVLQSEGTEQQEEVDVSEISEIILRNPKVFQVHYDTWKAEYAKSTGDKKFKQQYPTLEDYANERGKAFINARKKEVMGARVLKAKQQSMQPGVPVSITSEALENDADAQRVRKYLDDKENYEEFLTYGDVKDNAEKEKIYKKFVKGCGLQNLKESEARKLFEGIVGDELVFYIAEQKYDAAHVRMMEMVDYAEEYHLPIDPDKWNEEIEKAISQNATGALKESIEKTEIQAVASFSDRVDSSKTLEKPQDVATMAGVIIVGRGASDPDTYIVRYPNTSLVTRLKIEKKPGEKNYDNATFAIYDPHPDAGKSNWTPIEKKQDLRSTFNTVFLGALMYTDNVKKKGGVPNEEANTFLNSSVVARAADVLYKGQNLGDIFITPTRRLMFENFLAILMKSDSGKTKYGDKQALEVRLKVIQDLYGNLNKIERMRRELENPNSGSVHNLSTLLAVIDQKEKN